MGSIRSSGDSAALNAWRGQVAATGTQRELRTQLLHHRQELLPRFAALYRQLRSLPRRLRKALQRRWGISLAGIALTLTLQPLPGEAANFTAGTAAELVNAINTANSTAEADTITLTADITLTTVNNTTYGPTGLPVVSSAITIAGNHHTIRRDLSNPNQFRLLAINGGGNLLLQDTTLSGGRSDGSGGGINDRGQLTLEGCTVSGNTAGSAGGGVFSGFGNGGTVTIMNSTISGNTAGDGGGGVEGGTITIMNSTISGNTAGFGGGVIGGTLLNSTVSGNTAGGGGGGVFDAYMITNSTISGNTAGSDGGGVVNVSTITNSTISGNTAGRNGGGVAYSTITNSTISDNTANGDGGGVFLDASNGAVVQLSNSTISGNTGSRGGGIFARPEGPGVDCGTYRCVPIYAGTVLLGRNLVSGNLAATGAEAFHEVLGGTFSATSNLFGHNGLTTAQALSGIPTEGGNIIATSDGDTPTALDAILDTTLQNNGGPTLTHNLVAGSPAIDAAGATCDLTTDQRGAPRPVDGNGDGVAACDIGAVEFGSSPSVLDCSTATASVNFPRLGNRHRYPVTIDGVTAPPGDNVNLTVNSIFQDEPVINPTGKTCPDGIGVDTAVAKVRNERLLAGDGRVYHIGFTATDEAGASCTGDVQVCVPAKEGEACGDQGALFDSTECP